ncbi:MAG: NDP-sugar synthase [Candidatus Bathyarchaeota archaeon]|jgi:NDP-sugar pyrophosphorylase family protein
MNVQDLRGFTAVGGVGKRMGPLTYGTSKPCVRLLNRPIMDFALLPLAEQGVRNHIFGVKGGTNHRDLYDYYKEGIDFSTRYGIEPRMHFKYQPNEDDVGNADSLHINLTYYDIEDPVIVVQGDNVYDIDLADMIREHEEHEAFMTIALIRVENTREYGVADLDPQDLRIKRFVEKPTADKAPSNLVNAGLYLISPEIRKTLEREEIEKIKRERNRLDFGMDLIPYLVDNNFLVYGYELRKAWHDLGTPERYLEAMKDILHEKVNIRVKEEPVFPNVWIQGYSEESIRRRERIVKDCREDKLAIAGAALIGRHTRIGCNTKIADSNIDNFCIVGEHVVIEDSAIMDATVIEGYSSISKSIVGRNVKIKSTRKHPTKIDSGSVVGNDVEIREGCNLIGTRVYPELTIPPCLNFVNQTLRTYDDVSQPATKSNILRKES